MRTAEQWCRRTSSLGVLLTSLIVVSIGCSTHRVRDVPLKLELADPESSIYSEVGKGIVGYTTVDSAYHEFMGRAKILTPDSLTFVRVGPDFQYWNELPAPDRTLAVADVSRISASEPVAGGVLFTAVVGVGLVMVALAVLSLSSFSLGTG